MTKAYGTDLLLGTILDADRIYRGPQEITVAECTEDNGWLRFRGSLYVPDSDELRLRIIQEHDDTALLGHPGRAKTLDLLD